MPRLSLYKPEKGKDYEFLDRQILEMFTVGGTDIHIHKYIGTDDGTTVKDHTQIQDMLFLENRDRKYDQDIYTIRGIYNVQDLDFDLSQFGLFLSNDTLFLTIHIRSSVKTLGRKIMPGDVIEFPHLKDEYAENSFNVALKRFYVVEDVNRAAEGFSQTWYPHLYRVKLKQIYDGQEYKDILDLPAEEDAPGGNTLRDLLSTYEKEMQVTQAVVDEATQEVQQSGYDITSYFTLQSSNSSIVDVKTNIPISVEKGDIIVQDDARGVVKETLSDTFSFQIEITSGSFGPREFSIVDKDVPFDITLNYDVDETSVTDSGTYPSVGDIVSQFVNEYATTPQGTVTYIRKPADRSTTVITVMPNNDGTFVISKTSATGEFQQLYFNGEKARYIANDSSENPIFVKQLDRIKFISVASVKSGTQLIKTETTNDMPPPDRPGYKGYLVGTALPPNGETVFGHGISFPTNAEEGDYFLRTDFLPNRLFKYANDRWNKVQDVQRADLYGANTANNQKGTFINNDSAFVYTDKVVGSDYVKVDDSSQDIITNINYTDISNAVYLVIKYGRTVLDYKLSEINFVNNFNGKVVINLPDKLLPEDGVIREIGFYKTREAEKQGLSQALRNRFKPEADN